MNRLYIAGTLALAFAGLAAADEWNKKTNITVNETILVPGKQLPPGKYVMKLHDSPTNRHIVQIFNEDETQLQATIMAFNNEQTRPDPDGKTVLTYWETPAGSPPALRAWFYPGDTWGQEFAYPKEMAERLSAANHTQVASYDPGKVTGTPTDESLQAMTLPNGSSTTSSANRSGGSANSAANTSASNTASRNGNATPVRNTNINAAPERTSAAINTNDDDEPTLLAQNNPPPNQATPAPANQNQANQANNQADDDLLPETASYLPLFLAAGIGLSLIGMWLSYRSA